MTQAPPNLSVKPGYRPQATDTTPEVDAFGFLLLRQRTTEQRLVMGSALMKDARRLSLSSLRQRFSNLNVQQFARKIATAWLQEDCPAEYTPTGDEMTWIQDSTGLAAHLHPIFEALGIPYYITGGVAAIAYGEPRTTRDLDIVLAIEVADVEQLVRNLEAEGFYVPGIEDIVTGRMQTLGITHIESISRADLMLSSHDEFARVQLDRRQSIQLPDGSSAYFASPEDVILNKIHWGQSSQSEKQWRDVLGILKTQGETLDYRYLAKWAERLGILDALNQALIEAGI